MFAIVDIETTGGTPQQSAITEIAVIVTNGKKIIEEYTTLINPQKNIHPYVSKLTGITNQMVANAPTFEQVADKLDEITKNCVFVAHNVAFDYSILKNMFYESGRIFQRELLCTVKLGRKVFPGLSSYSLGSLAKELNLTLEKGHRAYADTFATYELFKLIYGALQDKTLAYIESGEPRLTGIPEKDRILQAVPEATGIYYLHDANNEIIYVGSASNLRKKIWNHLTATKSRFAFSLQNSVSDVSYKLTGSELAARLLEINFIKKKKPLFNRKPKIVFPKHAEYPDKLWITDKGPDKQHKTVICTNFSKTFYAVVPVSEQILHPDQLADYNPQEFSGMNFYFTAIDYIKKQKVENWKKLQGK